MTRKIFFKNILNFFICIFIFLTLLLFCACDNDGQGGEIALTEEQTSAYNEVTSYSTSCQSAELNSTLKEIKNDIKKYKNTKNEVDIAKAKIDILNYKVSKQNEINSAITKAAREKENYKRQMNSILFIYQGSESMYRARVSALESKISAAYTQALRDISSKNNNPSVGEGTKERYRQERMSQYENEVRYYKYELEELKTQWNNKVQYERLQKLYNEVEDNLTTEKQSIETKYENKIKDKNKYLETCYKRR